MKKLHISFSEYRLWNSCQFKHYLTKTLKYTEPTNEFLVFGSALHAAIEEIIKKKHSHVLYEGIIKKALEAESNNIASTSYFGRNMATQGAAILKELKFFDRFKEWEVIGVEQELYEPLYQNETHDIYFKGIVDLILKKGDEYLILDWKSALKPWDLEKKKQDRGFFRQLALYKHFFAKKHGIPLDKIQTRFVALVRDPASVQQYDIEVSTDFMVETVLDIQRTVKEIINLDFTSLLKAKHDPTNKPNCTYCIFNKGLCNNEKNQIETEKRELKTT